MKIPQRLSWGGITSITERTTQAREGWESRVVQKKTCCAHWGGNHPNGASQLCDGFSKTDQLPTKEYAGRTRLMRERIYTQTARQETGGTGYFSAIRSFFPAPAIRSL